MTIILEPPADTVAPSSPAAAATSAGPIGRWPLAGVVAGVAATASVWTALGQDLDDEDYQAGQAVLDEVSRGRYHATFLLGLVAVGALFIAAAGWRRWAEERAGRSLAARLIAAGLTATATVNVIGVSLAGSLALYLPGGMDEGLLSREALHVNFAYLDFGLLFGWWATVVAALAMAALSFGRSRLFPRWMGVVSVLLVLPPAILAVVAALPGMPGLTMPLWLIAISLGMLKDRPVSPPAHRSAH